MADERFSIIGTLEGNLKTSLEQLAGSATKVDKSIVVADKDVNLFKHSLESLGAHIKNMEATANLPKIYESLPKTLGNATAASDNFDASQGRFVARTGRVVQRLLSLQLAFQSISAAGPGSFGKFQTEVDAGAAALGSFASVASLFPNKFGLILGALAAGGAAFGAMSEKAKQAEERIKDINDETKRMREEFAKTRGDALVDRLVGTNPEIIKKQQELETLIKNAKIAAGAIKDDEVRLAAAERKGDDATARMARLDLQRQTKALDGFLQEIDKVNIRLGELEGLQNFNAEMKELDEQAFQLRKKIELGLIKPFEALQAKAELAAKAVDLAFKSRFVPIPGQKSGYERIADAAQKELEARRNVNEEARINQMLDEEIRVAREADAKFTKDTLEYEANLAKEKTQETSEFTKGIAQGIGQAFASATSELIDGLISGQLNMREFAGQFLLQISKMIAQALILKAVMAGLGVIGFNDGGEVPIRRASGGPIPGPNVNADIVPAMLTPGEFVIRKDAVDMYGRGVLHALNRGLIPPSALPAMSSLGKTAIGSRFAEGGEVPYGAGAVPKPAMAFVVSSNSEMERLAAGGDQALIRFFERNKYKLKAALGIGGR